MADEKAGTSERSAGSGRAPHLRRRERRRGLLRALAAGLVALALLSLVRRLGRRADSGPTPPVRADVDPWSLPGCYALRVGPWSVDSGPPDTTALDPAARERMALLVPPERVMFVADSIDLQRREETTYRAVPLGKGGDPRLERYLRWFVRADTVWILWSDGETGGVVALHASQDTLAGSARAFSFPDSFDAIARASAHRINCWSRERETPRTAPLP